MRGMSWKRGNKEVDSQAMAETREKSFGHENIGNKYNMNAKSE